MKKNVLMISLLAMSVGFTACNKDNGNPDTSIPEGTADVTIEENNIDVTSENITTWTQYATAVANLLVKDANDLNKAWSVSYNDGEPYAQTFKTFGGEYQSAVACVQQIVDGCIDIAGEVGTAKIGEPRDLWSLGTVGTLLMTTATTSSVSETPSTVHSTIRRLLTLWLPSPRLRTRHFITM